MGTVGSVVRVEYAGERKEFRLISKGATDSRLKSEPSDCMEIHVGEDVSQLINVMFVCSEWESSKGGLSTFNREFAVNLAKESSKQIKVYCYVCKSSEEDREDASKQGVNLITARPLPGCNDPMDWLKIPPPELPTPDVVVGHGRKFGSTALFISHSTQCKWIHFVHVFCEELGKHKLELDSSFDAIADNEEKNKRELELCEAANLAVAVGSRLQSKYKRSLPDIKVEVITPGIFENFLTPAKSLANDQLAGAEEVSIFMIGRGSFEDFAVKGYDIIGNAVASLDRKFKLIFVGSPKDKQRKIENWFRKETNIARNQLTIRGYRNRVEMKKMFREADLIVMPSRSEGFGLVALEAISAGVPVLVSSESGLAKALKEVEGGMTVVVDSEEPGVWARKIQELFEVKPEERHARAMHLRKKYGEIYSWAKECKRFEQMIHGLIQRPCTALPSRFVYTDQLGNVVTVKVESVTSTQDKGLVQTNRARNPPGMPPVSPGVLPVSVPYNPSNPMTGSAPSLFIPPGVQQPKPPSGSTPNPTTSRPTNCPRGPHFTFIGSRSDTQGSSSSTSRSPSTLVPVETAAVREGILSVIGQGTSSEGKNTRGKDARDESYVDFTDFYRNVAELGEDHVYSWDEVNNVAGEGPAAGMRPVSPGVLPASVPCNPSNPMTGSASSLFIPPSVQQPKPPSGSTPSPTTSTLTNPRYGPHVTVTGSRSDTQGTASSASGSPSTSVPLEPAAVREGILSVNGQGTSSEGQSKDGEDTQVECYVDFTDFYRKVAELGEDHIYSWDKANNATGETPAAGREGILSVNGHETSSEGQNKDGEDARVESYVDFADFYRKVAELGEYHVYSWDKANNAAGETPAAGREGILSVNGQETSSEGQNKDGEDARVESYVDFVDFYQMVVELREDHVYG